MKALPMHRRNGARLGCRSHLPKQPVGIIQPHFIGVGPDDTIQVEPCRQSVFLERLDLG